jgi:hypothetical protein
MLRRFGWQGQSAFASKFFDVAFISTRACPRRPNGDEIAEAAQLDEDIGALGSANVGLKVFEAGEAWMTP